jgi:Holliday junction resolvasome RuvABC endonuclease subunit
MTIATILRLPSPPRPDAADALAIALAHVNAARLEAQLRKPQAKTYI